MLATLLFAAAQGPTYLTCVVGKDPYAMKVEIVADEANAKALISLSDGKYVRSRTAIFSPDQVKILDEESTWVLSRVNLGLERLVVIGDHRSASAGRCEIKPAPADRAF